MDWGFVMGVVTAVLLVTFLGIVAWACRAERNAEFEEAARYPLLDNGEFT